MKVLYISHDANLYGATRSLLNLMEGLKPHGIVPYVILPCPGDMEKELKRNKIKYKIVITKNNFHPIGQRNLINEIVSDIQNVKAIIDTVKTVKEWKIDLIHTNNLCNDVGAIAGFLSNKPHVWHMREFMEEDFNFEFNHKVKMKFLINRANALLTVSKSLYAKYSSIYNKTTMSVVYNGFPLKDYIIDRDVYFNRETISLLLCGSICEGKGQLEAVKATEHLIKLGYTNVRLYLVGGGERVYLSKLKHYIKTNHLNEHIKILNFKKNLDEIRKVMDIALVCSKSEAFGRVTVESMLSELLVIGANTAGTKELISDKSTGLLYQKGDFEDLAKTIVFAMHKKEEAIEMIKKAKVYANINFSIQTTAENVNRIYQKIYQNRK